MALLIDTQAIVWLASDPGRLSVLARDAIAAADATLLISSVTAFEYSDLNRRGRFEADLPLGPILTAFDMQVLDYPGEAWVLADALPNLHRDPVDRMLIAHAIHADLTLVTADERMRSYPVRWLW